jgi:hypothetical protein
LLLRANHLVFQASRLAFVKVYQTAPADAFAIAMNEHRSRMLRLESVMTELERIAE